VKYFKLEEFACRCGCGQNNMDPEFLERVDLLRGELGFPLIVSSGFRCRNHNQNVSNTGTEGPHTTGQAADFLVVGDRALELIIAALRLGFTGIGVSQKGPSRFIHLDDLPALLDRPRPWLWSY
jgi:zinc D-Ala-D-Ala carboxypeptidase